MSRNILPLNSLCPATHISYALYVQPVSPGTDDSQGHFRIDLIVVKCFVHSLIIC
jgi:hypothetical protein